MITTGFIDYSMLFYIVLSSTFIKITGSLLPDTLSTRMSSKYNVLTSEVRMELYVIHRKLTWTVVPQSEKRILYTW